jgi:hypothetical protein
MLVNRADRSPFTQNRVDKVALRRELPSVSERVRGRPAQRSESAQAIREEGAARPRFLSTANLERIHRARSLSCRYTASGDLASGTRSRQRPLVFLKRSAYNVDSEPFTSPDANDRTRPTRFGPEKATVDPAEDASLSTESGRCRPACQSASEWRARSGVSSECARARSRRRINALTNA